MVSGDERPMMIFVKSDLILRSFKRHMLLSFYCVKNGSLKFQIQGQTLSSWINTLNDSGMFGVGRFSPFHNRLVGLSSTDDIIALHGKKFLQDVGSTVGFQRPYFHFTETLTTELRFTSQRLLGDEVYGPMERACILSSTMWLSFSM